MIKVTYIISDINTALCYEWVATYIDKEKFELSFILLNPGTSQLHQFITNLNLKVYSVRCRGKKDWPKAIWDTYGLLKKLKPDVVHCHLIQANTIGLIAASMAGIKKRIYTRHHSSLHHIYFPKGIWLDKLSNRLATHIIAISGIVKNILQEWEGVNASKVFLIPHGFLLDQFADVSVSRVNEFKRKYKINNLPVIGVISRFTEWKGIQYIIAAFLKVLPSYPNAVLMLLNAKGDFENIILKELEALPIDSYRLIPFEKDIAAAYKVMDVFVHVPIDEHSEAFGQIYIEALAAGVPSIFTRSGIANEPYFTNEVAAIVPYKDAQAIANNIIEILENKSISEARINAGKSLAKKFDLQPFIHQLENLYSAS